MLRMCFVGGVLRRVGRGMRGYVDFAPFLIASEARLGYFRLMRGSKACADGLWIYQK